MKLRRNHSTSNIGVNLAKFVVFLILLAGGMLYSYKKLMKGDTVNAPAYSNQPQEVILSNTPVAVLPYLPENRGEVVNHTYYTLSYLEQYEQAEWVAYEMTQELLRKPNVPRYNRFERDPSVSTRSAGYYDYSGSGYTRGHLAPAGDMAFDTLAMRESFYMSNMSPQVRAFNNGIWKELEEQTRDWVYHNKHLYITTGPILTPSLEKTKKGVAIPKYFYKVLLDNEGDDKKGIAFLIPHSVSDKPLQDYAITIDSLESFSGIDFFKAMNVERYESQININDWKFSEARYRLRVERWNNE